jgi:hypothetical protein
VALPAGSISLPAASLRVLMAHELEHVRRRDLLWNWLAAAAHLLFYFHPLVWLANREWQIAQESACDERALLLTQASISEYGDTLVRTMAGQRCRTLPSLAMVGAADSPHTLKRRLLAMRTVRPLSRSTWGISVVSTVLIGLLGLIPWRAVAQNAGADRLLFATNRDDGNRPHIYAVNADGTGLTRLTGGATADADPALSPDGKRIAYVSAEGKSDRTDLFLMDPDGKGRRRLTRLKSSYVFGPAWSPDGKRIAFTVTDEPKANKTGNGRIAILEPDKIQAPVSDSSAGWSDIGEGYQPVWAPDGSALFFSVFQPTPTGASPLPALFRAAANGADRKMLLPHGIPGSWSPDNSRLVYVGEGAEGGNAL